MEGLGKTTLGFSQFELIQSLKVDFQPSDLKSKPLGVQISFEPDDVAAAYQHACKNGALGVKPPEVMPWGWQCAFVRDPNGFLVELAKECK